MRDKIINIETMTYDEKKESNLRIIINMRLTNKVSSKILRHICSSKRKKVMEV